MATQLEAKLEKRNAWIFLTETNGTKASVSKPQILCGNGKHHPLSEKTYAHM